MLFVLIPRFQCMGACNQKFSLNVVRHLDHISCPICLGELEDQQPKQRLTGAFGRVQEDSKQVRRKFCYTYGSKGVKQS
jgi:hypothetical protein